MKVHCAVVERSMEGMLAACCTRMLVGCWCRTPPNTGTFGTLAYGLLWADHACHGFFSLSFFKSTTSMRPVWPSTSLSFGCLNSFLQSDPVRATQLKEAKFVVINHLHSSLRLLRHALGTEDVHQACFVGRAVPLFGASSPSERLCNGSET